MRASDYEVDSDPLSDFLDEACERRSDVEAPAAGLFKHYIEWADGCGLTARYRLTATMFGRKMTERFTKLKNKTGSVYLGLRKLGPVVGLGQ